MNETTPGRFFSTEVAGLPEAAPTETVRLADGDRFELEVSAVRKRLGESEIRMLAYNGSIPGPTLVVPQDSEIEVVTTNHGDAATTVHWHGLRLDNAADGVPSETQDPIEVGHTYSCRVKFPDPGVYWYHPHLREDFAQEMGLSGGILVEPRDPDYWPPADREVTITLDDLLIEDGKLVPFLRSGPTFTAMGRFGNTMLINGESEFSTTVDLGEVVRLHFINTANTRIFNVGIRGATMKLVGGDSGRYEREEFADTVLLSPSERISVDVLFDVPGGVWLEHRAPQKTYRLGEFTVQEGELPDDAVASFGELRVDPELSGIRETLREHLEGDPDKVLRLHSEMPLLYGDDEGEASSYTCPMHPEVTSSEAGVCPKCGMKLVPDQVETPNAHAHGHSTDEHGETADGLEWEDLMPDINRRTNTSNMRWLLVDEETGAKNDEISWSFRVGDQVKIRLVNAMEQDHPMHHPFHIHGAGRFLILAHDGEPEANLVWKDTVLIRAGETVDILLDVTNPGRWMAHCHIAEHTESHMKFIFEVT